MRGLCGRVGWRKAGGGWIAGLEHIPVEGFAATAITKRKSFKTRKPRFRYASINAAGYQPIANYAISIKAI